MDSNTVDWQQRPWLTALAAISGGIAVLVLCLTLALWQLPNWQRALRPVAQQVRTHQLPILADYPTQQWTIRTPVRPLQQGHELPRYILNAAPVLVPEGLPRIAIVIDDMGVGVDLTQAMIDAMPPAVTFSFLPYGDGTPRQARQARKQGHEIMVHLPMQPESEEVNPGPNALYVSDTTQLVATKIKRNLAKLKDISVGVNNHMGSAFTAFPQGMTQVLNALEKEKMFFLDSVTTRHPASDTLKKRYSIPVLRRSYFLDHYIEDAKIHEYLAKTEEYARKHGSAIAIGHPHNLTREALAAWIPTLEAKGLALVPITALIQ